MNNILIKPKVVKVITHHNSKLLFSANFRNKRSIITFLNDKSCDNFLEYLYDYRNKFHSLPFYRPGCYSDFYVSEMNKKLIVKNKQLLVLQNECYINRLGLIGVDDFEFSYDNNNFINFNVHDLLSNFEKTII